MSEQNLKNVWVGRETLEQRRGMRGSGIITRERVRETKSMR